MTPLFDFPSDSTRTFPHFARQTDLLQRDLFINVKAYPYYARGDDVADDTDSILAAASTGRPLFFPAGTYRTAQVTGYANMVWVGENRNTTFIKRISGNEVITATGATGVTISDLTLDSNGGRDGMRWTTVTDSSVTRVAAINCVSGCGFRLRTGSDRNNIFQYRSVGNPQGLVFDTSSDNEITDCYIRNSTSTTLADGAINLINLSARNSFKGCRSETNAGRGMYMSGAGATIPTDNTYISCIFRGNGTAGGQNYGGVSLNASTGTTFIGCLFQDNYENGCYVPAGSSNTTLIGCKARGNNVGNQAGGHGFEVLSTAKLIGCTSTGQLGNTVDAGSGLVISAAVEVIGGTYELNYSHGIRINGATGARVIGPTVRNNSQRGVGIADGIQILSSSSACLVSGARVFDDQGTKTQRYGVSVSGTCTNYQITDNDLRGNATGSLSDTGAVPRRVANNLVDGTAVKTAAFTVAGEDVVLADATGGAFTVTLAQAIGGTQGQRVTIKKIDASANAVTVSRAGTDTIEGANTVTLAAQYNGVTLIAGGNGVWYKTP